MKYILTIWETVSKKYKNNNSRTTLKMLNFTLYRMLDY